MQAQRHPVTPAPRSPTPRVTQAKVRVNMKVETKTVPLIDLVPPNHSDAQCRALLRSSRKFKPFKGRWVFTPSEAKEVEQYLRTH